MKKRVLSTVVAGGAALGAYMMRDQDKRQKLKDQYYKIKERMTNQETNTVEKAGKPEEVDHHENSKMVSEGSQFGVQYYNEVKEK
ncbi:hypothetical protein [Aquisalibacillus elongatus]|uniref:Uncharacterized protein n=1 Tax=Aquisalibacillus elongatus TaxID=485577 RepID=A0A3N5BHA1_9BACI|nr:hypothetical protein [Aquisalibacillus elongatus]RPF56129.1 hypothetical protein EDC24_1018 [Aquisalibacillus elongatus]